MKNRGFYQHKMCALIDKISNSTNEDLESVFSEGGNYSVGDKLREVWKTDRRQQKIKTKEMVSSINFVLKLIFFCSYWK